MGDQLLASLFSLQDSSETSLKYTRSGGNGKYDFSCFLNGINISFVTYAFLTLPLSSSQSCLLKSVEHPDRQLRIQRQKITVCSWTPLAFSGYQRLSALGCSVRGPSSPGGDFFFLLINKFLIFPIPCVCNGIRGSPLLFLTFERIAWRIWCYVLNDLL